MEGEQGMCVRVCVCVREVTYILSVSCEMGKLYHLVPKLAEDLDKFLKSADSLQLLQGNQHLHTYIKPTSFSALYCIKVAFIMCFI